MQLLPGFAAWRFVGAVDGFEVVYAGDGELRGHTSAVEEGTPYAVDYRITFDDRWHTTSAVVASDTLDGRRTVTLAADGDALDRRRRAASGPGRPRRRTCRHST